MLVLVQGETSESATDVISENKVDAAADKENGGSEGMQIAADSKKDPSQRRHELLMKSDLAEVILVTCIYLSIYSTAVI